MRSVLGRRGNRSGRSHLGLWETLVHAGGSDSTEAESDEPVVVKPVETVSALDLLMAEDDEDSQQGPQDPR